MIISNNVFNLKEFLSNQEQIWTKYDSIEENSLKLSEKKFINNLDRYILHTMEEVYEARDCYLQYGYTAEYISELNDITMYCGTMLSIVNTNLLMYNASETVKCAITFDTENYMSLKDTCLFTLDTLIEIRMLYKKRKWHKVSNELSHDEKYDSLKIAQEKLENLISVLLSFTLKQIEVQHDNLNVGNMISEKQQFVINLKGVN